MDIDLEMSTALTLRFYVGFGSFANEITNPHHFCLRRILLYWIFLSISNNNLILNDNNSMYAQCLNYILKIIYITSSNVLCALLHSKQL